MSKRLAPLVVVLAIPLLASSLAIVARSQWEARWSSGLRREFVVHGQRANARVMQRYSLATLCDDARTAARIPPCRTYNTFSDVIVYSGASSGLGLALLGGILAVGAAARRRREALVAAFRPALYVVTGILVLLLVAHALLGLQTVRLLLLLAGIRPDGLLSFLGMAALGLVLGASMVAARIALAGRGARALLAAKLDARFAGSWTGAAADGRAVVAGLVPEVFVAPAGLGSLDGRLEADSLHVPLTLARILSVPQFQALVRRAEYRAADGAGAVARSIEAWSAVSAEHAACRRAGGLRLALGWPILSVVGLLLDSCADAQADLERRQQAAADLAGAEAHGARTCGVAILKAAAFAPAWLSTVRQMREAARAGSQYQSASALFDEIVAANAHPARLAAALHPGAASSPASAPLRQRLERLGLVPEDLVVEALDVRPPDAAIAGAGVDLSPVEERLTTVAHLQLLHAA